ncbi:nicotinamidase-related amidase [Geomicrobium halophilum]|uniref:Nicotinamidase-related amidase n=1 Tax=Geomicrobium halophilum TaxID=549000 RepID=A0A841PV41_9BACL|nr:isochorismatase family cysteine hydrolase [Geomicrobium halophilum]MBB6450171.1 nicotinamidase-related amidase [Geomicrobium halophilum]
MKGHVSQRHKEQAVALLIIDMINPLEFEDGQKLYEQMRTTANQIARLKEQSRSYHIPVIYVNDNYGHWQSDFRQIVDDCLYEQVRGQDIAHVLKPEEEDYFILKPQFSGFFSTPLDILLRYLNVRTLILTGVAGNMCVHFTANDAYMHGYKVIVPRDCTASINKRDNQEALQVMEKVVHANIAPAADLNLRHIITEAKAYYEDTV